MSFGILKTHTEPGKQNHPSEMTDWLGFDLWSIQKSNMPVWNGDAWLYHGCSLNVNLSLGHPLF